MTCCRCNGTSSCKNCSCSKRKLKCTNCLPSRLDKCTNIEQSIDSEESSPQNTASSGHANQTPDQTPDLDEEATREDLQAPQRTLPDPLPVSDPSFSWGSSDCSTFTEQVNEAYDEVVHWKMNLCRRTCKTFPILCDQLGLGEYCT